MAIPEFSSRESKEVLRLIALLNGSLQSVLMRLEELTNNRIFNPDYIKEIKTLTQEVQAELQKDTVK